MNRMRVCGCVLLVIMMTFSAVRAADPATAPATTQAAKRTSQQIMVDLATAGEDLGKLLSGPTVLTDATKRAEAAPKALVSLQKMLGLADEMSQGDDARGQAVGKQLQQQLLPLLATFGDEKTIAGIETQAAGTDAVKALQAKCALIISKWWKASTDTSAQAKIVDDSAVLAKANPESQEVAQALMGMSQIGASSPELGEKLQGVVVDNMKGDFVAQIKEGIDADKKMKAIEGKPLTIEGKTVDGKDFSTKDWAGKVILVDFWATWCGPCVAELPRVKKTYTDFHGKGLEILGVSNDYEVEALKKFVAADAALSWTQIFDPKAAAAQDWHPVTKGFGITGIPTMFLIDKKGVCRTVNARENFEEMIPKLLAE